MHFKILSAICFNLDQSKTLPSGNGLSGPCTCRKQSKYPYQPSEYATLRLTRVGTFYRLVRKNIHDTLAQNENFTLTHLLFKR